MAYICLSYTPASRELAEQVHHRLEVNDFRVWQREPDLTNSDAASAAILDAAFKGATAFIFVWAEGETVPTYLSQDYHVAQTFKRPIYFINRADQIEQLIAALRRVMPDVDSFGPLPALSTEPPSAPEEDRSKPRSTQIVRLLSIGGAGLGLLTLIVLFLLTGRDDARETASGTPTTAATVQLEVGSSPAPLPTLSPSDTEEPPPSLTPTPSPTAPPTVTSTLTVTPSATATPSMTSTPSATATAMPTQTDTPTTPPTALSSPTVTPSLTPVPLLLQPPASPTAVSTSMPLPTEALPVFATNTPSSTTQPLLTISSGG